ncbi:hypothetical protein BC835DRAFT_250288 [Cytidiella melzeri]|nr:hypothetical protein BC835DRAFT_250288 [Cytidiella melzeri]
MSKESSGSLTNCCARFRSNSRCCYRHRPSPTPLKYYYHSYSTSHRWLVTTHICRRWRQVLLAYPRLSVNVEITKIADRVSAMLERSGQLPFTLLERALSRHYLTLTRPSNQLVVRELHRIQHLEIIADLYVRDTLSELNASDIPLVKTLMIFYTDQYGMEPCYLFASFSSWIFAFVMPAHV